MRSHGEAPGRRHGAPRWRPFLLVAVLGLLPACGGGPGGVQEDAGPADALQDDTAVVQHDAADAPRQHDAQKDTFVQEDAGPPPQFKPGQGVVITSGGGVGWSLNYEVHVSVGAPQPMGKGRSQSGYSMTLGPAVQP